MSLKGIHVICHKLLAQQRTTSYKHFLLSAGFSSCKDGASHNQEYLLWFVIPASLQTRCSASKKKIFILVTWITAWTGNDEADVREPDE